MKFKISILFALLITNQLSKSMQEEIEQITGQKRHAEETLQDRAAKVSRILATNCQNSNPIETAQDQVDPDPMQIEESFAAGNNTAEHKEPGSKYICTNNYLGYDEIKIKILQTTKEYDALPKKLEEIPSNLINILANNANNFFSTTLTGHTGPINSISFSPDGRQIATGSEDKTARIWNLKTNEKIYTINSNYSIKFVSFNSDSLKLAACSDNNAAIICGFKPDIFMKLIHDGDLFYDGDVFSISFSPDSKKFVTCSNANYGAKIWSAYAYRKIHTLQSYVVHSATFSPDSKKIVTCSLNEETKIWDADTGNLIHGLPGHTHWFNSVAFSHDSLKLAISYIDNSVKIWDVDTGNLIHNLICHMDSITSLSFSPDSTKLATSSADNTAKIWDANTGNLIHNLTGHTNYVRTVLFSPDGTKLATCSADNTVKIWDASTGNLVYNLTSHTKNVRAISFSPDGTKFATGSSDNTVMIWDLNKLDTIQDVIKTLNYEQIELLLVICDAFRNIKNNQYIKLSSEQKAIVDSLPACIKVPLKMALKKLLFKLISYIGTNNYLEYDHIKTLISQKIHNDLLSKLKLLTSFDLISILKNNTNNFFSTTLTAHTEELEAVSFSPDSLKLATCSADNTAKIWDANTGNLIHNLKGHTDYVTAVSFNPNGKKLATCSHDNTAKIWDVETGNLIHNLIGHTDWIDSILFSPDGKKLATCSHDKTAKIWNADTGDLIHNLNDHIAGVSSISFSPDGTKLATCSENIAKIWDVDNGSLIHNLINHVYYINQILFSPDGTRVATCSQDNTAKIWDAVTGNLIHSLNSHTNDVRSLAFSPDGKKIATGSLDCTAKIWDVDTGNLIHNLNGHTYWILSLKFSADCKRIASVSNNKTANIWDVDTGKLIHNLISHTDIINLLSLSMDGKKLATCSEDETAKIWYLDKIDAIQDTFESLNFEQLELLAIICDAFKKIEKNQFIKLSSEQKETADSLPFCIKVPLKMALKSLLTKFIAT